MAETDPLTLEEKVILCATGQELSPSLIRNNRTSAFAEAVRRLEMCRDLLAKIDDHFDLEESILRKDIDRVFAAVGLPTSLDHRIERAEAELAALKQQREEYLK